MKRRFGIILAAALLAVSFSGAASGHTVSVGGNCSVASAYFWGDRFYDPSGHNLRVCYGLNILRLSAYNSGGGIHCRGFLGFAHDDWNDCLTSTQIDFITVPSGVYLCLYKDDNYGGNGLVVIGDWNEDNFQDLQGGWTDSISSMKWSSSC